MIAACHGTASATGLSTLRAILDAVRAARPGLTVVESYLDVASPTFADVIAGFSGPAVVVPVLLSGGYHVRADIPAVVGDVDRLVVARPLGPDHGLSVALAGRLAEARSFDSSVADAVVLVAAGSSDPLARADVDRAASDLASLLGVEVVSAVLTGVGRRLDEVFLARPGAQLEVATYLLAEGFFQQRMRSQALDLGISTVSAPLGAHPAVVDLVLDRFDSALADAGAGVL